MPGKSRIRNDLNLSQKNVLSRAVRLAELVFFPSFCKICGSLLESPHDRVVCRSCLEKIKPRRSAFCLCCGRFFEGGGESHLCSDCLKDQRPYSLHRSCARYEGILKDAILLFKYRGYKPLGKHLSRFVFESLKKEDGLWWDLEAIIPVPLHPKRLRERGFNQALVIAKELSKLKKIPLKNKILKKVMNVAAQTSLEREERIKNVRGVYRVTKNAEIKGKVILLVDDVYTTGSTLKECSAELKKAGAKEVRAITIAQA
jgi:ComF family protein